MTKLLIALALGVVIMAVGYVVLVGIAWYLRLLWRGVISQEAERDAEVGPVASAAAGAFAFTTASGFGTLALMAGTAAVDIALWSAFAGVALAGIALAAVRVWLKARH